MYYWKTLTKILCFALSGAIAIAEDKTPPCDSCSELYIVHSERCAPCQALKYTWTNNNDFRLALQEAYAVKDVNFDVLANRPFAVQAWSSMFPSSIEVPFFFVKRNGRIAGNHVGFVNTPEGIADLMADLGVEWPRVKHKAVPKPDDTIPPAKLEEPLHAPAPPVERKPEQPKPEQPKQEATTTPSPKPVDEPTREPTGKKFEDFLPIQGGAEGSGPISGAGDKASGSGFLPTIASLGVKAALIYFGLPVAGAGVAGAAIGYLVRRKRAPSTVSNVLSSKLFPTTTNHYLTKEVDVEGEAYKEAIRRVVAANGGAHPVVHMFTQQIEHTASELMRGKNIATRNVAKPFLYND